MITKDFFKKLTNDQKRELFKKLGIETFTYGYGQGTITQTMKDGSIMFYSYNKNIGYSKAAYFKDFNIRIVENATTKTLEELPIDRDTVISYFRFMLDIYNKDYYLYALVNLYNNNDMISMLYQAYSNKTLAEINEDLIQ